MAFSPALGTAIRHHQEQELEALSNTVLHMALLNTSKADIHRMFLNWLNEFTSWHLILLRYLHEGWGGNNQPEIHTFVRIEPIRCSKKIGSIMVTRLPISKIMIPTFYLIH
ncbi:hypothetical protein [Microcoleus sp. Pol12B5]|uniref:hypothetical protein n=1 Tax=Microcoleus sp. Pol12B5 TaxID=3055396 RepID=UPI002FD3EFFE